MAWIGPSGGRRREPMPPAPVKPGECDPGNEQSPPPRYTVRFAHGTRRARPANWRYRCPQRVPTRRIPRPRPPHRLLFQPVSGPPSRPRRIGTPISPPAPPRWIAGTPSAPPPPARSTTGSAWQSSIDGESQDGSTSSATTSSPWSTRNQPHPLRSEYRLESLDRDRCGCASTPIWGVTPGVAPPGGRPFGQNDDDKIYITSDPGIFELDYNSGAVVGRQDLERIPSTEVLAARQPLWSSARGAARSSGTSSSSARPGGRTS